MNSILLHPSHVKFKLHDVEHRITYAIYPNPSASICIIVFQQIFSLSQKHYVNFLSPDAHAKATEMKEPKV